MSLSPSTYFSSITSIPSTSETLQCRGISSASVRTKPIGSNSMLLSPEAKCSGPRISNVHPLPRASPPNSRPAIGRITSVQVELYTSSGCPYSAAAREDMEWRGMDFVEYDVEHDRCLRTDARAHRRQPHGARDR